MGRLLDALKQAEARPTPHRPATVHLRTEAAPDSDAEVPFIEVGPRKSLEASPSVLAAAPPTRRPPGDVDAVMLAPAPPRYVAFRALPAHLDRAGPRSRLAPDLVAFHAPDGPAAEQYRELLASLLAPRHPGISPQTLLFATPFAHASTAAVVLNAAITAARQGRRRVVVVDAGSRRPGVASLLGLPDSPCLRDVLDGSLPLDQALRATEQDNLLALTASTAEAAGGVRFQAETLRSLLRQLRQRFDLVFVDGARWDGRPDVTALAAACDAVYVVLPEADAEAPEVDGLLRAIPAQGGRLAGCILAG